MTFTASIHRLPEFTSVKLSGPATLADFLGVIADLGRDTRLHGDQRVLVDLLDVDNEFRFTDHFQIGEAAASQLSHLERLASVVPGGQLTRTSERVAVRQGLQLRVFASMNDAIHWLSERLADGKA